MGSSGRAWIPLLIVAAALLVLGLVVPLRGSSGAPSVRLNSAPVPLDGTAVALPLGQGRPEGTRVKLRGSLLFDYTGRTYVPNPSGADQQGFIGWSPAAGLELVPEESSPTCAVLLVKPSAGQWPESVQAWVDVDRFVDEFIITPSEVRRSLSGDLTLEVYSRPQPGPLGGILVVGSALCVALAVITWLRRDRGPDMGDVAAILRRIDEKHPRVRGAVDDKRWDAGELRSQLARLRDGAHELAGHIEAFRNAARRVNREQVAADVAEAERQLEGTDREELERELEATLEAKRKVQTLLTDTDANEARYVLRLSKIESALDALALQLAEQESRLADDRADRKAMDALSAELESLDAAIGELSILDDAPT